MKDLLLIKKLNPSKDNTKIFPYTFQLDDKLSKKVAMDIFCDLKSKGILTEDQFMIKDKSFTVKISSEYTTQVIKEILARNLNIYGVYIPYGEMLEKGEINE